MNNILNHIAAIRQELSAVSASEQGGARRLLRAIDLLDALSIALKKTGAEMERSDDHA